MRTVRKNAKCRSSPAETGLYTARIASQSTGSPGSNTEGVTLYKPHSTGGRKPSGAAVGGEVTRVRTPRAVDREILGTVTKLLGASHLSVLCLDNVTRMCRIRGKMKKRTWIREGDIVIVVPWEIQDEKGDVTWRYTAPQVSWLERKGFLNGTR